MRLPSSTRMAVSGLTLAVLVSAGAGAVAPKQGEDALEMLAFVSERLAPRPEVEPLQQMENELQPRVREAFAAFQLGAEGEWAAFVDRRTGRLEAAAGAGIPWIPGRGNRLTLADVADALQGSEAVDLSVMERIARRFLPRVTPLLGVQPERLRLNRERSGQSADYLWRLDFDVIRGELPVEGSHVAFTVNHGNLIQIEAENLPAPDAIAPDAVVKKREALSILSRYIGGFTAADWFLDGGSLHLIPVGLKDARFAGGYAPGKGRGIAPVWQFTFVREGSAGTWRARVDASSGELLELVDLNDYAHAYVRGGVMFGGVQTTRPMPFADVTGSGANSAGVYDYTGGTRHSTLNGTFVGIVDTCGPIAQLSDANGKIDFGLSPSNNCSTPGTGGLGNTRSARTQFFHLNRAKEMGRGWFPANAWLSSQLTANVNLNSTCNAFWNGATVNFYRSGGGCGNTGELEEVSLHEYGHGFDQNDGNGSSADLGTGETYGDFTAALVSHTSCLGDGFYTSSNCGGYGDSCLSCTGIRDIDWAAHVSGTPHTVANFTQLRCPASSYAGPCGREGHCESYVSSEALWDLAARDLPGPGSPAAWAVVDRLWHLSRPSATSGFACVTSSSPWSSHGCAAGTYWRAMRAVDDDDGNLANGTPHGGALFAAFNRHLIACTTDAGANVTFASCTAPATPTISLTPGDDQVAVSWSGSGGSTVHDVYRNDLGCGFGMARIANDVAGTSLNDTNVADAVNYSYMVVAHPAGNESCAAPASCVNLNRLASDTFSSAGALNGRAAETGAVSWTALPAATVEDGRVIDGGAVAGVPFNPAILGGNPTVAVAADIDPTLSSWIGVGFADQAAGPYWIAGKLWALVSSTSFQIFTPAGVGATGSIPGTPVNGFHRVRVQYTPSTLQAVVSINGVQVFSQTLASAPNIQYAGFHFYQSAEGGGRLDNFQVTSQGVPLISDTFSGSGVVNGRPAEVGGVSWVARPGAVIGTGVVLDGAAVGGVPINPATLSGNPTVAMTADIDPTLSSWIGVGFADQATGPYWITGKLWALVTSTTFQVFTPAGVGAFGSTPGTPVNGFHRVRVQYTPSTLQAVVSINGVQVFSQTLSSAPNIQYAGFHFYRSAEGGGKLDNFKVYSTSNP